MSATGCPFYGPNEVRCKLGQDDNPAQRLMKRLGKLTWGGNAVQQHTSEVSNDLVMFSCARHHYMCVERGH
jgi:hypothetical protein